MKTVKTVKTGVKTGVKTVSLRVKTVKTFVPLKNYVFLFFRKNSFHGFHTPASGFHNSFHGFHTSSHTPPLPPPTTHPRPPPPTAYPTPTCVRHGLHCWAPSTLWRMRVWARYGGPFASCLLLWIHRGSYRRNFLYKKIGSNAQRRPRFV